MTSKKSVDLAYCVELRRNVYIDEARSEFFYQSAHKDFHFLCTDPGCLQPDGNRTQILATHYKLSPNEATPQAPCFRHFPKQNHAPHCVWLQEEEILTRDKLPQEKQDDYLGRIVKAKQHNRVDVFIRPGSENGNQLQENNSENTKTNTKLATGEHQVRTAKWPSNDPIRTTSLLETLVTAFVSLHTQRNDGKITEEEFFRASFTIRNEGEKLYYQFFRKISYIEKNPAFDGVLIGRVLGTNEYYETVKFYGKGFRLVLQEKINNKPVRLYMDSKTLEAYRYRNNFYDILKQRDTNDIKIYLINAAFQETEHAIEINLPSPACLSMRLMPK